MRLHITHPELFQKARRAFHISASTSDHFQRDGRWYPLGRTSQRMTVNRIVFHNRQTIGVGDTVTLHTNGDTVMQIAITSITLTDTNDLSSDQIADLGYADADDYREDWGQVLEGRIWYVTFQQV